MARLIALDGDLEGQIFPIEAGLTLGREKHNAIAMPTNRKASRDHAKVWKDGPRTWSIADLGSTNGTLVDDERVDRQHLEDGSVIQVGDQRFRFELEEAERPKAPAARQDRPDLAAVLAGKAGPSRESGSPAGGGGGGAGGGTDAAASIEVKQRILQYNRKEAKGTALGYDVGQLDAFWRWGLYALALGVAIALFFVVRGFVVSGRSGDEGPSAPEEAPYDEGR